MLMEGQMIEDGNDVSYPRCSTEGGVWAKLMDREQPYRPNMPNLQK